MDEQPSSPEDGLEDALRRALSNAVDGIEPGTEGLNSIRARIGRRPPRPWLLAVLSGAVERVKFWTWRGHWAWPGLPLTRAHLPWMARRSRHPKRASTDKPRGRGDTFPPPETLRAWPIEVLWLATGLACIAVIASFSFGVQPVRQAIIEAGTTVLSGGGAPSGNGTGTNGARAQTTTDGSGTLADGGATTAAGPSPTSASGSTGGPGGAAPGPGPTTQCRPPALSAIGKVAPATPVPGTTSPSSSAGGTTPPGAGQTAFPVVPGTTRAPDHPTAPRDRAATPASTCTVSSGTATTTPADATGASSAPADTTPADTPTDTPTDTPASTPPDPTPAGTPTATPASTPTATPTDTPASTADAAPAGP